MSDPLNQAAAEEARKEQKRQAETSAGDVADGMLDIGDFAASVLDLGAQIGGACLDAAKTGGEAVAGGAVEAAKLAGEGVVAVAGAVGEALSGLGDLG
jgi:hypothetical protein